MRAMATRLAGDDREGLVVSQRGARLGLHRDDARQPRRLGGEPPLELVERGNRTLDLEVDPLAVVPDEPGKPGLAGDAVDEGPEPDALHLPADPQPAARSIHASQASMPSPVFAETRMTSSAGLTCRAFASHRSISKSR